MSARVQVSPVVYLRSVAAENFLRETAETLERLRHESEARGHPLLASLLAIAKGESEDDLRTLVKSRHFGAGEEDTDDGAALMARKLARRGSAQT
jgi:hypothetical protein